MKVDSALMRRIGIVLAGMAVQEGAALLVWGGWRGFSREPARRASFALSTFSAIVAAYKGINFSTGQREMAHQRVAAALIFGWILTGKAAAAISDRRGILVLPDGPIRWFGLTMAIFGSLSFEWARQVLGKHYSIMAAIQTEHKLITSGPYRWVRHPGYASLVIYHAGYTLIHRSLLGFASVVPLTLAVLWRIRDEEALLTSEFGQEYRDYSQRTARLFPGIY